MIADVGPDSVTVTRGGEVVFSHDPTGTVLVTPEAMVFVAERLGVATRYAASIANGQSSEIQATNVNP